MTLNCLALVARCERAYRQASGVGSDMAQSNARRRCLTCASALAAGSQQLSLHREPESSVGSQQGVSTVPLPSHLSWLMDDENKPSASATEDATANT